MGYNTVAFILNDFLHEINKSPKSAAFRLSHPARSKEHQQWLVEDEINVAKENNEPYLHPQAIEVLPTFHADETHFYRAGQNCIVQLKFLKFGKTKEGKRTVTLELPDWDKPQK